jgi:flagellar biosynthesis component FlhA
VTQTVKESLVIQITEKTTYAAAASGFFFGLSVNDFGMILSLVIALATCVSSVYFQWRRDKREERESQEKHHESEELDG